LLKCEIKTLCAAHADPHRSGYRVLTTCSSRNFDLVKSLGAEEAFDYKDEDCAKKIKEYARGELKYVWDTIALESTAKICADVIAPGGTYGAILVVKLPRDDVKETWSLGYTAVGDPVKKGKYDYPDTTGDFEFARKWIEVVDPLLAEGKIKTHPAKVDHGLDKVLEGCDLLRHDKVSGQKLVYTV
jgi:NADPH:quinone reductase-like Zn-dependent oxidoreductase